MKSKMISRGAQSSLYAYDRKKQCMTWNHADEILCQEKMTATLHLI